MEISTKLFNQKAVKQFSQMNEDIQNLQNRVATGKNILRASDDPVAAVNLSVAKEQRALVERFEKNAASAHQTLTLTDGALQQAVNVVTESANWPYKPETIHMAFKIVRQLKLRSMN